MPKKEGIKSLAQNRKARHDYTIEDTLEAGISLYGTEVKSIRLGRLNLRDCYVAIERGEAWVHGMHISPYDMGSFSNRDPMRSRRLLLHKAEIRRLQALTQRDGYTIIPLSVYLSHGLVKLQLGVCKGKKDYDKREDIAARDAQRDMARSFREHNR